MVTEEAYAALQAENARLREQLANALQRIAELEAKKTPPPAFVKANVAERPEPRSPRRKRAPEQNRARRREEPSVVVEHPITLCPDCGSQLGGVHVGRTRQVVDLPPPVAVVVTAHRVQRGWCSACGRWREASLDLRGAAGQAFGQGRLGVGIASLVAHLRTVLRLPLRTIQRYLADLHGLRVSVGEIVGLLHRVAAQSAAAVAAIRDTARTRTVVHADETGWREDGHNGYVWLLATPEGERYVAFHHSRAGAVANGLLGEAFGGVLVSDFYGGYNDTPGGRHQRCWVHLLRDLRALAEAHTAGTALRDVEVRAWTGAVRTLWQRVCTALAQPPPLAGVRVAALHADLRALAEQFVTAADHPCRALAWRLWHFQHELLTCLTVPGVPPDNNAAERALRPLVVARKISGGTRSPRGSATRMALYSLAATWTAQGHNPLPEFRRLLQTPLPQI